MTPANDVPGLSSEARDFPALTIRSRTILSSDVEDALLARLADFGLVAIHDLVAPPLPPGGLWDPTYPPPPDPPSTALQWRAFFDASSARDAAAKAVTGEWPDLTVTAENISDEDWAARSQRSLTAIAAGRFIVAPPWDVPPAGDRTVIVIDPSRGFGTGHHASTRLCLEALSEIDVVGRRVLDLGTGSGVLAMAAILSGARSVLGVDVDQEAIDSARQSAALNPRVGGVQWLVADFRERGWETFAGGPWDLVLANLTGGMLNVSAPRIRELLAPESVLVCSGFDESERASVEQALELDVRRAFSEDGWTGLVMSHK